MVQIAYGLPRTDTMPTDVQDIMTGLINRGISVQKRGFFALETPNCKINFYCIPSVEPNKTLNVDMAFNFPDYLQRRIVLNDPTQSGTTEFYQYVQNQEKTQALTWRQIYDKFKTDTGISDSLIDDYYPCGTIHDVPYIPMAILVLLKSGNKLIYIAKDEVK